MGMIAAVSDKMQFHYRLFRMGYYSLYPKLFHYYLIEKPIKDFTFLFSYSCNKDCGYCKVGGLQKKYPDDMTVEDFNSVLTWLSKNGIDHYKIQGGEPTIYPHMRRILEITKRRRFFIKRFYTNLLSPDFKDYAKLLTPDICEIVYVHILLDSEYTLNEKAILHANLSLLRKQGVEIGFRHIMLNKDTPYEYLFTLAKEYGVTKVRTSIAFRSYFGDRTTTKLDLDSLKSMAPTIIGFIEKGLKTGLDPQFFNPFPRCAIPKMKRWYFREGYMRSVCFTNNFLTQKPWIMKLAIVINPDLTFAYCEGCFLKGKKKITEYKNPKQIFSEMKDIVDAVRWIPQFEDCVGCKYFKKRICQGTCLANKVTDDFWTK